MKNTAEAPESDYKDSGVLSSPLSLLHNGEYGWGDASSLRYRGGVGYLWFPRSANTTNSNISSFSSTSLYSQNSNIRSYGFAVRCFSFYAF